MMEKTRTKRIFMISAIVLMLSVTVAVVSCVYMMEKAQANEEYAKDEKADGLTSWGVAEIAPQPTELPTQDSSTNTIKCQGYHADEKVVGKQYTYYRSVCPTKEHPEPTADNITYEEAISAVVAGLNHFFGFQVSDGTYIDVNFNHYLYEVRDLYFVVINNDFGGRTIPEGEGFYTCSVNAFTGEVELLESNDEIEVDLYADTIFQTDDDGNKVDWDYPSYFKNTIQLKQLKKECREIADNFLKQSGVYDMNQLSYVKTEAYEDIYPWRLQVFYEKGEDLVTVSIYAENKVPFSYSVITSDQRSN